MKSMLIMLSAVLLISFISAPSQARDIPLYGKDAKLHRIVSATPSGVVQVPSNYDRAISVKKLSKDEAAYWNPDGGKYITAGDYAFVWASVVKGKGGSSDFHWIAVSTQSLYQALDLMHKFAHGVAFYRITSDGKEVTMEAYPYDTLHAIAEGEQTVDVKE